MNGLRPETLCNRIEEAGMDALSNTDDIALEAGIRARLDTAGDRCYAAAMECFKAQDYEGARRHLERMAAYDAAEDAHDARIVALNERGAGHIRGGLRIVAALRALLPGRKSVTA